MINLRRRLTQAMVATAGAVTLLGGGVVTAPAHAAPNDLGRVCMFNAPAEVPKAGHVAWAFRVRGEKDHWIWGSFNRDEAWTRGGTWKDVRASFKPVWDKKDKRWEGYTRYRCTNTKDGNARNAQSAFKAVRDKGYSITRNNCLHMSMAVFKGYSGVLRRDARLPSATAVRPNDYFSRTLSNAKWERIHRMP
ncbi:hypothetical protein [Streptomyces sp. SP18CS02]|uniref:hypothetical protein n=1 Tax=Streptomyces sp. SP18CS02 TaxID=3002531 RepID=UPI002E7A5197|nr:hypothetical protein [Streptomyces sp. SP18CS02]MEE1753144.1 hypothetical protein [Streptomyces sp. SP18CS02]